MGTKHKHAEVIKAWADGEEIEYSFKKEDSWKPCNDNRPGWYDGTYYRVKPKNIVVTRYIEYIPTFDDTSTYACEEPNLNLEFTPEGKLVSVEMIK